MSDLHRLRRTKKLCYATYPAFALYTPEYKVIKMNNLRLFIVCFSKYATMGSFK